MSAVAEASLTSKLSAVGDKAVNPLNPQGLKPCCACPETKSKRDDCFLRFSSDEAPVKCEQLIEAHKACMRGYGFKV
ncbi:hypothetical protein Q5752_005674 [Cryptotrichosporon argae]